MSMMSWPGHIPFPYRRSGLETVPHNAKIHFNYGNFLRDTGRTSEAIRNYRTAIRYPPSPPSTFCSPPPFSFFSPSLPLLFISLPSSPLPPPPSLLAPSLAPDHAVSHNNLGTLLGLEEGEHHFREAVKHNPQHYRAFFNLGSNLRQAMSFFLVYFVFNFSPSLTPCSLPPFRQEPGETGRGRSST